MKKITLILTLLIFTAGIAYGATATEFDSNTGNDSDPVVSSVTFSGLPTGASITNTEITTTIGYYVGDWYDMNLDIGGTTYYNVGELDHVSYFDLNGLDPNGQTITVTSVDLDDYSDYITLTLEVTITYVVAGAPGIPTNPSPADGATGVALSGELTWDFGTNTNTYDLWFGEAGSMAEVVSGATAGTSGSYSYSGLTNCSQYEWQVIAHNSAKATTEGPVWSFTTALPSGMVQVGDGTETGKHLPIEPYYGYDYTQSIYLSSDFSGVASDQRIEKLYYNYTKTSTGDTDEDNWTIWIGTTSETNLDAGYIDVSTLTEVFDGSVGFGALPAGEGWLEITLTTPFIYDPASDGNLVIAVHEYTGSYTSGSDEFYCDEDTRANVSRYYYSDSENPDPTSPPSGTASAYYPNTRFIFDEVPTNPIFSISPASKDFGIVNVGEASQSQTFTISNTGGGTLTISDVSLTGTDATEFGLTDGNTYPHNLGANQSITVDVVFAPSSVGEKIAELSVESSAKVTHTATLTGTGWNANYGGGGTAQGGYYFANSLATGASSYPTYSWYPNQTGGTNEGTLIEATDFVNGGEDDGHTNLMNIFDDGSNFTFFGNTYAQMYLSTNGTIGFGDIGDAWHSIGPDVIPSADGHDNMIAWCWDDLDYDAVASPDVNIRISRLSDRTIVTYWHYPIYSYSGPWPYITAQVVIYKDGRIFIMYNDDESTYDQTLQDCSIGIENSDGLKGVGYRYEQTGGPIFGSNLALAFGTNPATLPVELIQGSFVAKYMVNEYGSEYVTLEWATASETGVLGFNIWRSETNDFGTAGPMPVNGELIRATNTSETHYYSFDDFAADAYATYYYWLEIKEMGYSSYHGPIRYVPGDINGDENPDMYPVTKLWNNYPNPVTSTTTIRYQLKGSVLEQDASINIYNIRGQLVKTVEGIGGKATLNASDLGNGIYFYRLKTDTYDEIKKMIVVK